VSWRWTYQAVAELPVPVFDLLVEYLNEDSYRRESGDTGPDIDLDRPPE
jgi:hypothetical protein